MACTNFVVYQTDESETKGRFVELKTNGEEKKRKFFTWHWHFHDIIRGKLELEWLRDIANKNNLILNNVFNTVTEKKYIFCPIAPAGNPKRTLFKYNKLSNIIIKAFWIVSR